MLHEQGIDVLLLEARDRVGGRTFTIKVTKQLFKNVFKTCKNDWIIVDTRKVFHLLKTGLIIIIIIIISANP